MNSQNLKILTTGVCVIEAPEDHKSPRKVKLSLEKPGNTYCLPDKQQYKQVGLFTFKKVKGNHGPLRCTSRVASMDMNRLLKAQWNSSDARVKVSVKWRRGKKQVIFIRLLDFLHHLVTVDSEEEYFILHLNEGKVLIELVRMIPEEDEKKNEEAEKNEGQESVSDEQMNDDGKCKENNTDEEDFENYVKEESDK